MKINRILIAVAALIAVLGAVFLLNNNANKGTVSETTVAPVIQDETASGAAVTLISSGFSPQVINIKEGTKVTWTNSSGQKGNVSSGPHPTHSLYPPLNLGDFLDGATVSLVFDKSGTYGYHNHLNTTQTGTVVVVQ